MVTRIILIILFGAGLSNAARTNVIHGEDAISQNLSTLVVSYLNIKDGQPPRNWNDLEREFDIPSLNRTYQKSRGFRIQDKYAFINSEMEIPYLGKRMVVLVRSTPISMDNSPAGRFVIYATSIATGVAFPTEKQVEKMFADAGKILPGRGSTIDRQNRVNGSDQYVPSTSAPVAQVEKTPALNISTSSTVSLQSSPEVVTPLANAKRPSHAGLIYGLVILAGVLVGAFVYYKRRK